MPMLDRITLPLTVPEERVDLIPPDSQSAIQKPSVLLELITLRVTVGRGELYWPEAELAVVVDQVACSTLVLFAFTSIRPTACSSGPRWPSRSSWAGDERPGLRCAGEVLDGQAAHGDAGGSDSIAVAVFDIST